MKQRVINKTFQPIMFADGSVLGAADTEGSMKNVGDGEGEIKLGKADRETFVDTGKVSLVSIPEPTQTTTNPPVTTQTATTTADEGKKGGRA